MVILVFKMTHIINLRCEYWFEPVLFFGVFFSGLKGTWAVFEALSKLMTSHFKTAFFEHPLRWFF